MSRTGTRATRGIVVDWIGMQHVIFNATSLRPGGGLTVLLGMIQGMAEVDPACRFTVVCSADATREQLEQVAAGSNLASSMQVLQVCPNWGAAWRQLRLGAELNKAIKQSRNLVQGPSILVSINQFVSGVPGWPQVVYHLNLLRFLPIDPKLGWRARWAEWARNRGSLQAISHASANVYESHYLQSAASKIRASGNPLDRVIYIGLPDQLVESARQSSAGLVAPRVEAGAVSERPAAQLMAITNGNPHKDNATLIRTMAQLVQRRPEVDWRLKIAGGLFPELWRPYQELAAELNVLERIEWLGFVDQSTLTAHLKNSLCLVSTSRVESFCMVALESMARGCPAIVADASSMPESVGAAGILCAVGEASQFAEAVVKLYEQPEVRNDYVSRGFEHVARFRWAACGEQFLQLFSELPALGK